MKNVLVILFFVLSVVTFAQIPTIQWQKTYGGPDDDRINSIILNHESDFLMAGSTKANGGDIVNHQGYDGIEDGWIFKTDLFGNILWSKMLGGSHADRVFTAKNTWENGFIFVGGSFSNDSGVSHFHYPSEELWVVKTDSLGNLQWQICIGGSDNENGIDITQTVDSGFLVIGETRSFDGDIHGFHGVADIFLVKLSKNGIKQWTKAIGGSDYDYGTSCLQTLDGGYLISGGTSSNDGDISGLHGFGTGDGWIAKINSLGAIQWQRCYGGTGVDEIVKLFISNNNFYFICYTNSIDGDVSGNYGISDFWLVKCDSLGAIIWQRCYGGISGEDIKSAQRTSDGGFVMVGVTYSDSSFLVGNNNGIRDIWVIKTDSMGVFEWGKCLGGSDFDYGSSVIQTPDSGYLVCGWTTSTDGDITSTYGNEDAWVVKLTSPTAGIVVPEFGLMDFTLTPQRDQLLIRFFCRKDEDANIKLFDINGKLLATKKIRIREGINYHQLSYTGLATGMCIVEVSGNAILQRGKVLAGER